MTDLEKLDYLKRYCYGNFVTSVCEQYDRKGFLTKKQWTAVERMISRHMICDDDRDLPWDSFGDGYDV